MTQTVLSGRRRAPGTCAEPLVPADVTAPHGRHARERPTFEGLPDVADASLLRLRDDAAGMGLVIVSAGLLLAAAIVPSGAATLPEAATPGVALTADVTLPSVIAPPGAHMALGLESAGRAVPRTAPGPASAGTGAVTGPALPVVAEAGASAGPVLPAVRQHETFTVPVSGAQVSSAFGYRLNPISGSGVEFHTGIDYALACGTAVVAAEGGTVTEAGWHAYGGGQRIVVDHGEGMKTTYNHLSVIGVVVGQPVNRGVMIGAVGSTGNSTGCHLHFEVMVDDEKVDPQPWL